MNHQLHAAAFIEKSLGNHGVLGGDGAQDGASGDYIFHGLLRGRFIEATFQHEPFHRGTAGGQVTANRPRYQALGHLADLFSDRANLLG